jgi:methylmalonyl-CoA/ethylmalonyl-CoA epimerase
MHHVAYEVDDVSAALADLAAAGAELIDTVPRPGLFGLQVAFVHPDAVHGVLTEVVSVARLT